MIKEEFTSIKRKLEEWRKERHITTDMQLEHFEKLIGEEYLELTEALGKLQTIKGIDFSSDNLFSDIASEAYYNTIDAYCDMIIVAMNAGKMYNEIFTFKVTHETGVTEKVTSSIKTLCKDLRKIHIYPYTAILEAVNEISSRTGDYDETKGKWVKHKVQENLYKANYSLSMFNGTKDQYRSLVLNQV